MGDKLLDRAPLKAPFAADLAARAVGPTPAVQWAIDAIRNGADPKAVRARLRQMSAGNAGADSSGPFANLVQGGSQQWKAIDPTGSANLDRFAGGQPTAGGDSQWRPYDPNAGAGDATVGDAAAFDSATAIQHAANAIPLGADPTPLHSRFPLMGLGDPIRPSPVEDQISGGQPRITEDLGPLSMRDGSVLGLSASPASNRQNSMDDLRRRSDPSMAPQKSDAAQKYLQAKSADSLWDRAAALGHGIVADVADYRSRSASNFAAGGLKTHPPTSRPGINVRLSGGGQRDAASSLSPHRSYRVPDNQLPVGLNGWGYRPQEGDALLLARAIYAECGRIPEDMPAVGWSMINRIGFMHPRMRRPVFGSTLAEVLNQRTSGGAYQYSIMNNGGSREWRQSADPANIPETDRAAWARAVAVANAILSNRLPDPSGGALYFFHSSTYVPNSTNPREAAPSDFPGHIARHEYVPAPYQSRSTLMENGRPRRTYLFREAPVKEWAPRHP